MKGSMKKLVLFVMIAAIAMFMVVAMASAGGHQGRKSIQGEYAVTGSNACLLAPFGFDVNLLPINGLSFISHQSWEGVYTFAHNGTGTMKVIVHEAPGAPSPPTFAQGGGSLSIFWEFTYTVTDGGKITFYIVPGSYLGLTITPVPGIPLYLDAEGSWDGRISPDGKNMHITWGAPLLLSVVDQFGDPPDPPTQAICSGSFSLFRILDGE